MKKFYAIFAAALMSISVFASKDVIPSDAVLADYYDAGQVCVCIFVPADMACYDVVLTGSFNRWMTTNEDCIPFEAVEGYDGWYVAAYEPEAEPDAAKGFQAKPIMKDGDGRITWAYQVGAVTLIRGGVQAVAGYEGEIDLINYGTDAPNVYIIDAWKMNPCTAVYHNYNVVVLNSTGCDNRAIPFIIGEFNHWNGFQQMQFDAAKSKELGKRYFYYNFKAAEGSEYYIVSGLLGEDGQTIEGKPTWEDKAYLQVYNEEEDEWIRLAGTGSVGNLKLGTEANIEFDFSDAEKYRWARCVQEDAEYTVLWINLPAANCPERVEIIGTFDSWEGTELEHLDNGWWFVELEAKASQYFKIRSAGLWPEEGGSEIELYDSENDAWKTIGDGQFKFGKYWSDDKWKGVDCKWIAFDLSETARWTGISDYRHNFNISCNEKYGKVYGTNGTYVNGTKLSVSAEANYGYHFVKWSDGNTDNPRTIILYKDMNLTAIFAPNTYTFSVSCDEKYGKVVADNGEYDYLTELSISAKANYGYHFAKWSDGNTSNPRTISLTKNMNLTAIFAPNIYTISDNSNQAQGYIAGAGRHEYLTEVTLVATPKYGYHFTQWSDGITEGSRKVTVTQDSTFTALFAPNKYTFSTSCDEKYGKVVADNGEYDYLTQLTITANANYGYHFVKWSDGNTSNPRVITLTKDTELTANFAPNTYTISDDSDKSHGYIANAGAHTYLSEVLLEATPNYGYHFVKWSDGKTNNPRTVIVTQDISLAAEFDIAKYGTCGDDNALTWTFDDKDVLTISGNGALNSNYTFGLEAPESMQKVVIESGVSSVGNGAFKNKTTLNEIAISHGVNTIKAEAFAGCSEVTALTLGANLQSIGANAFNGCKRIDEITVYAERVIDITETTFANIGNKKYVYVYVPEASLRKYQRDDYWSEFDLRVIGATTTTVADDEVNVEPTTNTADVTWPAVDNAATYELTIKDKNGNVICTLVFNAQGQLTSIAFAAPGRSQYAAQVAGFTFTVTGLDSGSSYSFTMEAKDSQGAVLDTKEGSFTTAESGIATSIDNESVDTKPIKVIRDNQLFILRSDKTYTVQGQEVK